MRDNSKPLQYHCKKCNSSSIFSSKTLQLFGIYDAELTEMLSAYNNSILSRPEWINSVSMEGVIHRIDNFVESNDILIPDKVQYINGRLGTSLTADQMIADKIVLNLSDLLVHNRVRSLTRAASIVEDLNKYFIGFLSYDNGYVNMRRLCEEGILYKSIDKRYVNYNIFNTIDNSMRFYVIPSEIDLMSLEPIDIWIAEGPFDALSLKYNVYPNQKRSIFISAGGKGYLVVVRFILEYLGLINIRIHLCPDGDVEDRAMYNIRNVLYPFNLDISIDRNVKPGQKDFGVPKEDIDISSYSINKRI